MNGHTKGVLIVDERQPKLIDGGMPSKIWIEILGNKFGSGNDKYKRLAQYLWETRF